MAAKKANIYAQPIFDSLNSWNTNTGLGWTPDMSYNKTGTQFQTYCINELLPKVTATIVGSKKLGNKFDWLAKEIPFIGQLTELYVFKDVVPVGLNLDKNGQLFFRRNYPQIMSVYYNGGDMLKQKITLNDNDARKSFRTLGDAIKYVIGAHENIISCFNLYEEKKACGMLVDYAETKLEPTNVLLANDYSDMATKMFEGILDLQENSNEFTEYKRATGGSTGSYTAPPVDLGNVCILTTNAFKTYLLDTKIANTYQVDGMDLTNQIISFKDLGKKCWKTSADVTVDQAIMEYARSFNDYQMDVGDVLPAGSLFTFDPTAVITSNVVEVKPSTDFFCYIFDIRKPFIGRMTKDMYKPEFLNREMGETNHWLMYGSEMWMNPFKNSTFIKKAPATLRKAG